MSEIREKAKQILSVLPPIGEQINSSNGGREGPDNKAFTDITNTAHSRMRENWNGGGIMTACNGFTGWYGTTIGAQENWGVFGIEAEVKKKNAHAWVKSTPDNRPKFGDLCRYTKFHVGISLDFEGDIWTHADAGQGGSKMGFDVIRRTRDKVPYSHTTLQGWIDLDLYFGAKPAVTDEITAPPRWLTTWWTVNWRNAKYYYHFTPDRAVTWSVRSPVWSGQPGITDDEDGVGRYRVSKTGEIIIDWPTGSVERFVKADSGPYEDVMNGTYNGAEPLHAVTLF